MYDFPLPHLLARSRGRSFDMRPQPEKLARLTNRFGFKTTRADGGVFKTEEQGDIGTDMQTIGTNLILTLFKQSRCPCANSYVP